jgi:hypothetical protein
MKRVEFIYLSQEDILGMNLPLKEVIHLVERGLSEHGRGRVENSPKPGIHPKTNSYGQAILNADKFITDDWEQTQYYQAQGAFPDGLPQLYAELGAIVSGQKPGREGEDERILAINIGLALEDVIVANRIYEIARERCL